MEERIISNDRHLNALVRAKCRKYLQLHGSIPNPYPLHTRERQIWNDEVRNIARERVKKDLQTIRCERA